MPSSSSSSRPDAPIPQQVEAVVFDMDGTIYDNRHLALNLMKCHLSSILTLWAERKARRALKGQCFGSAEALYRELFHRMSQYFGSGDAASCERWYYETYMPRFAAVIALFYEPRPLFVELVQALRSRGIRVYVFSDYGALPEKLEAMHLDLSLFDGMTDAATMGGLKPCQSAFQRMLDHFHLSPATTLMVGDREDTDGTGARSVGMPFYNVKAEAEAWDKLLRHYL